MNSHALVCKQTAGVDRLIGQIRSHSLQWAEQLAGVGTRRDLESIVSRLFNDLRTFQELIDQADDETRLFEDLPQAIHQFMVVNLYRGLTLKDLAKFLGYSEKYCSELFHMHMGETFSLYLKRMRLEEATRLLEIEQVYLAQVSQKLGFSDQFAFSHFFKRALGYSPKQFRKAVTSHAPDPQAIDKAVITCR